MGRRHVAYTENVTSAVQKRLNQSSCRFAWECMGGPKESCIRLACTLAPRSNYGWTIVRGGCKWVCYQGWRRGLFLADGFNLSPGCKTWPYRSSHNA